MKQNYLIQLTPEELGVIIKEALVASMGQFIENINLNKKDKLLNREQVANILGKSVSTIDNYKRNLANYITDTTIRDYFMALFDNYNDTVNPLNWVVHRPSEFQLDASTLIELPRKGLLAVINYFLTF